MNEPNRQFKRYLWKWLVIFFIFLTLSALINFTVDPYGLFDRPRIKGFNQLKPSASSRVRITKAYQVINVNPKTLIAGNSRPEIGLDPSNSCWPESSKPVFNLGLPGASVYMASRYIQHSIASNDVEKIFWGLDFMDFLNFDTRKSLSNWPPVTSSYEKRLVVDAHGESNYTYFWMRAKDHLTMLFSLDALKDSVYTVLSQYNPNTPTIRRNGFRPREDLLDIMALEGQGLIFKQVNIDTTKIFRRPIQTLITSEKIKSQQFESVRQLLIYANKNNVDVTLFINPYHSDYLAIIQMAGLWEQFSSWKIQLTYLAEEFDVSLWDFSGFNNFSNTQPPVIGDNKTILEWFWEPAHYRSQYGDLMLSQMLNLSCHTKGQVTSGTQLTKSNIYNHLLSSDKAMLQYRSEFSKATDRLFKLIQ